MRLLMWMSISLLLPCRPKLSSCSRDWDIHAMDPHANHMKVQPAHALQLALLMGPWNWTIYFS